MIDKNRALTIPEKKGTRERERGKERRGGEGRGEERRGEKRTDG